MRVLVTGATGFLGSHLVRQLVERGDKVRILVRASSDWRRLDGLDLERVIGDVTDARSVDRAVDGVEVVVHCAGVVEFGPRDPSAMERVNVAGTEHVLGAAARVGARAVHVSSASALGPTPADQPPQDESWWSPDPPAAAYEDQKRRAHLIARQLIAKGASVRIAMPGGIYGMGDQGAMYESIKAFVRWPLPIGYLPEVRQSTVNVDDCADALIRIAEDGRDGEEYLVVAEAGRIDEWLATIAEGAGHRPPLLHVPTSWTRAVGGPVGLIAGWLGRSPSQVPETIAVATHDSAYSGDKLRRELGWQPRSLAEGMREMAEAIRDEDADGRTARRAARAAKRAKHI